MGRRALHQKRQDGDGRRFAAPISSGLTERAKDGEESFDFRAQGLDALNVGSMRSNSVNTA